MPRDFFKRHLPDRHTLTETSQFRPIRRFLGNPYLWHLNRRSVSGAVAVGLFSAYLPMPLETLVAAGLALVFRVNLPLSVALVWISNPLTWIPMYGAGYLLGAWLLNEPFVSFDEMTVQWLLEQAVPLWLGCILLGLLFALLGFVATRILWRYLTIRTWQRRRRRLGH